jgi:hypothetical protein
VANLHVVRVNWTGFLGAPGVSTFYFDDTSAPPLTAVRNFFDACKSFHPNVVNWSFPNSGRTIDVNGNVIGAWSVSSVSNVVGTAADNNYSSVSGYLVRWNTGTFVGGRELRGKTFMVPASNAVYDIAGTIQGGMTTSVPTAANALIAAAPTLRVWSRRHASVATVSAGAMPDKAIVLRTRRD